MRLALRSSPQPKRAAGLAVAAAGLAVLGGCEVKQGEPDLVNGKKLFVQRCGSCHQLSRADTQGVVGPDLDNAFRTPLRDGMGRGTVRGVVEQQILYPSNGSQMPAKLVTGRDAQDVAAYVAAVAAQPGKDTGALADAVGGGQKPLARAQGGRLNIPADPNGRLIYTFKNAQASPGALTISSPNPSTVPHNIALEGGGLNELGPIGSGGSFVSTIRVNVKPGQYTFYCSVQGHRQGGMVGKLTIK